MEKIHNCIIHIVSIPLYLYYFILYVSDEVTSVNRKLSDKLFLKRIRMTEKEFDEFMEYKKALKEKLG